MGGCGKYCAVEISPWGHSKSLACSGLRSPTQLDKNRQSHMFWHESRMVYILHQLHHAAHMAAGPALWLQASSLVLQLALTAVFLFGSDFSPHLETTATVAVGLVVFLVLCDALLLSYARNPVLERFLRWVLYFQIVTPLALIYGMLVAVRGAVDSFALYFVVCLVVLPGARLVLLCWDGIVEFVVKDA